MDQMRCIFCKASLLNSFICMSELDDSHFDGRRKWSGQGREERGGSGQGGQGWEMIGQRCSGWRESLTRTCQNRRFSLYVLSNTMISSFWKPGFALPSNLPTKLHLSSGFWYNIVDSCRIIWHQWTAIIKNYFISEDRNVSGCHFFDDLPGRSVLEKLMWHIGWRKQDPALPLRSHPLQVLLRMQTWPDSHAFTPFMTKYEFENPPCSSILWNKEDSGWKTERLNILQEITAGGIEWGGDGTKKSVLTFKLVQVKLALPKERVSGAFFPLRTLPLQFPLRKWRVSLHPPLLPPHP